MKISGSIYSNSKQELSTTIRDLEEHHIDMLHVDCLDDVTVFEDIKRIRCTTALPVDLHLITSTPFKFQQHLDENPVDFLTLQFENLNGDSLPKSGFKKLGLALTSATPLEAFAKYSDDCDFVLLMATTPGKSGGEFNKENFRRIREFRKKFPDKQIHVDGGVNAEVSFILRNLGVHCAVSGSYLFTQKTVGSAVLGLKNAQTESHYRVADFMHLLDETPSVSLAGLNLKSVLQSIEDSKMAFTAIVQLNGVLDGIISNADVRKGMLKSIENLSEIKVENLINSNPIVLKEDLTVTEMLHFIRQQTIPINFLPVINSNGILTGSLTFNDLIKGEA